MREWPVNISGRSYSVKLEGSQWFYSPDPSQADWTCASKAMVEVIEQQIPANERQAGDDDDHAEQACKSTDKACKKVSKRRCKAPPKNEPAPAGRDDGARLSDQERLELDRLESEMERDHAAVVRFWQHLQQIKERRLFRETHDTFAQYVEERWGLKKTQAYSLVQAAETLASLSAIAEKIPEARQISKQGQLRELAPVPGEKLEDVVGTAVAIAKDQESDITAKVLREARKQVLSTAARSPHEESQQDHSPLEPTDRVERDQAGHRDETESTEAEAVSVDEEKQCACRGVEESVMSLRADLQALGLQERFDRQLTEIVEAAQQVAGNEPPSGGRQVTECAA